jgi:chromosome segregation and condensation protein ScpB
MTTDLEKAASPAEMIRIAVSSGADLEKLAKLLDLQERWEANEARKAYHKAMSEFKSNPIKIEKDKKVNYKTDRGSVAYSHATLANVVEKITIELSKYGLSASWKTKQEGKISVTCKITHSLGHSEETTLQADADTSGSKNQIQALGSAITYLERYTLLAALGLATSDMDDDGVSAPAELIDEKELSSLRDWIADTSTDELKFLEYLAVDALENLPKKDFKKALNALETKKRKGAK